MGGGSDNTVNLYYLTARAILAKRAGNLEAARRLYGQTLPHAEALRRETAIVRSSSSHANAENGLDASGIETAWKQLAAELGVHPVEGQQ